MNPKTALPSFFLVALLAVGCAAPRTRSAPADSSDPGAMSYDVELNTSFDAAITRTLAELKKKGFGQISRIDLHKAF